MAVLHDDVNRRIHLDRVVPEQGIPIDLARDGDPQFIVDGPDWKLRDVVVDLAHARDTGDEFPNFRRLVRHRHLAGQRHDAVMDRPLDVVIDRVKDVVPNLFRDVVRKHLIVLLRRRAGQRRRAQQRAGQQRNPERVQGSHGVPPSVVALLRRDGGPRGAASEGPLPPAACYGAPCVGALRQNLTDDQAGKFRSRSSAVAGRDVQSNFITTTVASSDKTPPPRRTTSSSRPVTTASASPVQSVRAVASTPDASKNSSGEGPASVTPSVNRMSPSPGPKTA